MNECMNEVEISRWSPLACLSGRRPLTWVISCSQTERQNLTTT